MAKSAITQLPVDCRHENYENGCCEKATFQTFFPSREFFQLKHFILHWKCLLDWQLSDCRHENHENSCCEKATFQTLFPSREFFQLKHFILHWKYLLGWQLSGCGFCQYNLMTKSAITQLPVNCRHENHENGCCEKATFQTSFPSREFFQLKHFILHWKYLLGGQLSDCRHENHENGCCEKATFQTFFPSREFFQLKHFILHWKYLLGW